MPMPPVSQCSASVSSTACHEKKNGAARQPMCRIVSQITFAQFNWRGGRSSGAGFFGTGRPEYSDLRCGVISNLFFVVADLRTGRSTTVPPEKLVLVNCVTVVMPITFVLRVWLAAEIWLR